MAFLLGFLLFAEELSGYSPTDTDLFYFYNRHWRYISSFHGPWLQLPPEVLESLAYSNYLSPRPQPIDPAVFFDLVKIRRLIEEATNLVVRAANGTTSSSLNNSLNASNGLMGGGSAAALGLGIGIGGIGGGGGGTAKLSRERRHRMREHATQKLSHAYHLDEVAASVATMQSASALEEVAKLVLQRNEDDCDAKYVHFFHEKIPSRSLARCTSLQPLDEVIASRPSEGAPFRTRAVTRIFKDDYVGAARDLTEGLQVYRLYTAQHRDREMQLEVMDEGRRRNAQAWDSRHDTKIEEKDQPNSLEPQLLFHRGGVHLTIACQQIENALDAWKIWQREQSSVAPNQDQNGDGDSPTSPTLSPAGKEAYRRWLEARKIVKTNAKRALRDYMSFLSHFDYSPGLPSEVAEEFLRKVNAAAGGYGKPRHQRMLLDKPASPQSISPSRSDADALAMNGSERPESGYHTPNGHNSYHHPLPPTEIHPVSALFSATPPPNLPPYPVESQSLVPSSKASSQNGPIFTDHECHEAVTYHPLLTDALHSILLAHALIQTSSKELLRHAHMVTRLARVCDGYPIFLAARSPARADWIEVIRRADNWIGLQDTWESLCAPAPLPGQFPTEKKGETEEQAKERRKHEAIMDALADDRVQDEGSFRAAVRAREIRAEEQRKQQESGSPSQKNSSKGSGPKRWAQEDGKEYPISTDRAELVARWIREAPAVSGDGTGKSKRSGKRRTRKPPASTTASTAETSSVQMEDSFHELSVNGDHD